MQTKKNKKTISQVGLEKVVRVLSKEIYSGMRLPRERLLENDLAETLAVNRMLIRQALTQLKSEGLVTIEPYKGASVADISLDRIYQNYQIISMLEGFAAYLATDRISEKDLKRMNVLLRKQRGSGARNVERWQDLNRQFHRIFNLRCGNEKLIGLIRKNVRFTNYWFLVLSTPGRIPQNLKEHESILQAFESRNAQQARLLLERHIIGAGEYLVENLRQSMSLGVGR